MSVAEAIAHAWTDANYKSRLVAEPGAALAEHGIEVPEGTTVKVVENSADTHHVVLPIRPANADKMSPEELEKIAAGRDIYPPQVITPGSA